MSLKIGKIFDLCFFFHSRPENEDWQNSSWLQNLNLPQIFGIQTSNTSELINSMIDDYHSEGWMELVEGILHHVTQVISHN